MTREEWDLRLRRIVVSVEWIALAIGIVVSVAEASADPLTFVAAGLGGIWVLSTTSIPLELTARPFVLDAMTLLGVGATMTALVLTGGMDSPYLLLALTPAIYAGMFGGIRLGLSVGGLIALLAAAIPLAAGDSIAESVPLAILAIALGLAIAQIHAQAIVGAMPGLAQSKKAGQSIQKYASKLRFVKKPQELPRYEDVVGMFRRGR